MPISLKLPPRPASFDDVIGRLYRANGHDIADVVSGFPEQQRARLALFCYGRAHMREIGLAVAATCELHTLVEVGATVGQVLHDLSREKPRLAGKPAFGRHKITLAAQVEPPAPFVDHDPDPELAPEAERAPELHVHEEAQLDVERAAPVAA